MKAKIISMLFALCYAFGVSAQMPTEIGAYSQSGIIKVASDEYNINIPVTYLAYKDNSVYISPFRSYVVVFLESPIGNKYTITGDTGNSVFLSYMHFPYTKSGSYIFIDLQKKEPGTWRLKLVQQNAGDWYYFYSYRKLDNSNIEYSLDSNGELSLKGEGEMPNFSWRGAPWYNYRDKIKSVNVGEGITTIGDHSFKDCSNLTLVKLPSTLTSLGDRSFEGCSTLSNIDLPENLTSLGVECFLECSSLESVIFPDSLTSLGGSCFFNCKNLASLGNMSEVTYIGSACFFGCSSLKTIVIKGKVTSLPRTCFKNCSSLESIELPDSLTSLGDHCFEGCSSLWELIIPKNVTTVGKGLFDKCTNLSNVYFMPLTSVFHSFLEYYDQKSDFSNWATFWVFPDAYDSYMQATDNKASFSKIPEFTSIEISPSNIKLPINYKNYIIDVKTNPSNSNSGRFLQWKTDNETVASVSSNCIRPKSTGTTQALCYHRFFPEQNATCYISIGDKLNSLSMPNKTISIGKGETDSLVVGSNLENEYVKNNMLYWSSSNNDIVTVSSNGVITGKHTGNAYIICKFKSDISISDTCTVNVECDVDKVDITMSSVTVEKGKTCSLTCTTTPETKYPEDIMWTSDNTSIANVSKDGVVTGVGYGATYIRCTYDNAVVDSCKVTVYNAGLVYVGNIYYRLNADLTAEVTNSGDSPRKVDSEGLEYAGTVNIPSAVTYDGVTYTVKSIRPYAFYNMRDLQAIVVPSTVETIDILACAYSKKLAKVMFLNQEENLKTINDKAFYECSRLNDVALPNSTLRIDKEAFRHCTSLSNISLGKSLNFINEYAFADCPVLDNLKFPETLKSIQTAAFTNDEALSSITFPAGLQGIGAAAFSNCTALKHTTFETYNSTLTVGMGAFNNCTAMEKVNIAHLDSWAHINFSDETANPTSQAHHLFMDGAEITDAFLPTSTRYINNNVFTGCTSLKSISIPSTVEYINDNILYGCTGLQRVTCHRQTPPPFLGTDKPEKMNDVFENATLYVLDTAADSYNGDSWWNRFKTITGKSSLAQLVLTPQTLTIKVGETYKLRAAMVDENSNLDASGSVSWLSSDKTVATVKGDGTVTGIGLGTTVITCKNPIDNTMRSTCTLTVVSDGLVKSITLDKTTLSINSGDAIQLRPTVGPESAVDKTVRWTSSNIAVATVNSDGIVTGIGNGTAVITCEAHDGSGVKATCQVNTTNNTGKKLFNPYTDFMQTRDIKLMFDVKTYGRYYFVNDWETLSEYVTAMYVNGNEVTPTQYMDLYPGAYWVVYRTKDMDELPMATFLNMNGEEVDEVKDSKYGMMTEMHIPGNISSIGAYNGYGCWQCADIYVYGRTSEMTAGIYVFNKSASNPNGAEACGRYVDSGMKNLHICNDEPETLPAFLANLTGNGYNVKRDLTWKDPSSEPDTPEALYADMNMDGTVNVTDVVALINYISTNDASNIDLRWVDMNEDGTVNVTDVVYLINYISSN